MLTKIPKSGDEVFVTAQGFRNETRLIGTRVVEKVGRSYLYVQVYGIVEKFRFDGKGATDNRQELWDSEEAYKAETKRLSERSVKITKIKEITSDWNFGKDLKDKVLDEILQLLIPQVH